MPEEYMTYIKLKEIKQENEISYSDLLLTNEWKNKRHEILKRDNYYCQNCGKSDTIWHSGNNVSFKKVEGIINGLHISIDAPFNSNEQIYLHVHHTYYIDQKLPWEYENESLKTLCNQCHMILHENTKIPIYTIMNDELVELKYTPCSRCNGVGYFPEYSHIQGGICFRCKGVRYEEFI